jgi:predicted DNA-binding antitoxin AbrB/MazE fold protein
MSAADSEFQTTQRRIEQPRLSKRLCRTARMIIGGIAMNLSVQAVYEDGVFKPLGKLDLNEHEKVQLTVQKLDDLQAAESDENSDDPLKGVRAATGIADLAEHFDDYRFGRRRP